MLPFEKIQYLLCGFSAIAFLAGTATLFKYNLPKLRNAEDVYTLLPQKEWTHEKFKAYIRHDLISRFAITLLLTGAFWLLIVAGIHMFISYCR